MNALLFSITQNEGLNTFEAVVAVLIGIVIMLIVYDFYLYANDIPGDTISNTLRDWAYGKYFGITFAWGVLAGHFFLGAGESLFERFFPTVGQATLLGAGGALLIVGIFFLLGRAGKRVRLPGQLALLIVGLGYGHFFWPII